MNLQNGVPKNESSEWSAKNEVRSNDAKKKMKL